MASFKQTVETLYHGTERRSVLFRYLIFAFDIATITYFIAITPYPGLAFSVWLNKILAVLIGLDFVARFWVAKDKREHASYIYVWADAVVLFSLLFNNFHHMDFSFLRILRGLRLAHSPYLLSDLRRASVYFREHEATIVALNNLFVFLFTTSAAVFSLFPDQSEGLEGFVTAIYFTVATLTTTGFGDITPQTTGGMVVTVVIMIVGVTLFVQLARALFMPNKVRQTCDHCGLSMHDPDAVHCKHCGEVIHIRTDGNL